MNTVFYSAPTGPPRNFSGIVEGLSISLTWSPPEEDLLILSYTLSCSVNGEPVIEAVLNPIQTLTLDELLPSTTYVCSLIATTSGGNSPPTPTPLQLMTGGKYLSLSLWCCLKE